MRHLLVAALAAIAITMTGCASASSTLTPPSGALSGSASIPGISMKGTETFTSGKVTDPKVMQSNNPTLTLHYTGPVVATGTFSLGGGPGPKPGQQKTFVTTKGSLVLQVVSDTVTSGWVDKTTCYGKMVTTVSYKVVGSKSTGSFRNASGTGIVVVMFESNTELNGKCSLAQNAQPTTLKGAFLEFTGTGPLTVMS